MKMILRYYVRLAMLLLPVAFLPVVNDPFGFGKNWLLMTGALLGVVLVTLGMAVEKKGGFKSNKILVLMGLMTVWGWLGWLRLAPGARMLSITEMGGVGTVSALLGWLFVWLQTDGKEEREKQLGWLTAGGLIAAAVSVTVFMVPTSRLPLVWPRNNPVI